MLAEAQRLSMLRTMGVDVYRLRSIEVPVGPAAVIAAAASVAVICPQAASAGLARFRDQLPRALGLVPERVRWQAAEAADLAQDAVAYVALGTEAARALGVQLSTMQQNRSTIAVTAEPAALLRDAAAKRALWHALKAVVHRLRDN
jgi:hypothetical protein